MSVGVASQKGSPPGLSAGRARGRSGPGGLGTEEPEFYLLTEGDNGDLVAMDYPTELVRGEPAQVVVGIRNREHD